MNAPSSRRSLLCRSVLALCSLALMLLVGAGPVRADASWSLTDEAGHRYRAMLFKQPFPEYPSGLRVRFNALDRPVELDHDAELLVTDSLGHAWHLPNRSEELVPKDRGSLPAGSAQFDLDALTPRPSEAIPLQVALPTAEGPRRLDLTPAQTMQLHSLSNEAEQ